MGSFALLGSPPVSIHTGGGCSSGDDRRLRQHSERQRDTGGHENGATEDLRLGRPVNCIAGVRP
ncbi:MAG: hypothetical protein KC438_09490, partial [Thermomicrobiales bacterium]|nr:hypothetical protein [Thermomicrobiales bacterium]